MNIFRRLRLHLTRLPALALAGLMAAGISAAQSPSSGSPPERWVDTGAPTTQTRGVGVDRNGWHRDRERGWYFYETDPNPPPVVPVQPPQGAPGSPKSEPEPLSVLWLQQKLEETRIAAIDNPTRENVELYVYLQKMAMDKAEKFAIMAQQVAMVNPDLDENFQNPTSTFVRRARLDTRDNEQERVLRALAENVGIYYFYRSDCAYCARQNPILKRMEAEHGLRILPISIDHLPSHDGAFPNWQPDQGQARALGVKLIGTVSSPEKAALARENGAWATIDYTRENIAERVLALTDGKKVPVVYDGVGKDTWEASLDCLQPRGLMVSFGNASGPVTGVSLATLAQKGSLFVTRPVLAAHVPTREKLQAAADELFGLVAKKKISARIAQRYALADAAAAHTALAARQTTGATVFMLD